MEKRTREIIALALLVVLAIAVVSAMAWYILVGHRWNVAATNIDESIGNLDGYTVFVYEGTLLPDEERIALSDSQPMLDDLNRGEAHMSAVKPHDEESLSAHEVAQNYREKGACVFMLYPENPGFYNEALVTEKAGQRLCAFSIDGRTSLTGMAFKKLRVRQYDPKFVVALVSDARLLENPIDGIDIVVCCDDEGIDEGGRYFGNMYCVDAPYRGQVQAIIVAPSGVKSSKTITSL